MRKLTLEEKIGQVFMFGFPGNNHEDAHKLIRELKPGGIIYFARNCSTVEEVSSLSSRLQDWAASSGAGIPLFIAADQEGGIVARLTQGIPVMPGPLSLSAAVSATDTDVHLIEQVSRAIGVQLRSAGINVNLAPVLDVNDNPDNPVIGIRSFGEDPCLVSEFGVLATKGFLSAGVLAVGKHFPGHGNTSVDSHLDLPALPHSMERLNSCELMPFRAAINAGIPAIMSAHILFQAIDTQKPATLSHPVLTGLLRDTLGFQGLIMTDCLEMNAISKYPGTAIGAVEAFKAGCDLLLISHTRELQEQAWLALLEAVKSGEVSEDRLDRSVELILRFKEIFRIPNALPPKEAYDPEYRQLSENVYLRSITLVKNQAGLVPLLPGTGGKLSLCLAGLKPKRLLQVEDPLKPGSQSPCPATAQGPETELGKSLRARYSNLDLTEVYIDEPSAIEKCLSLAQRMQAMVILTQNASKDPVQAQFVRAITEQVPNTVLVATRDPYDIRIAPNVHTYLCTYSNRPQAIDALAQVLLGTARATGKLPVRIPGQE